MRRSLAMVLANKKLPLSWFGLALLGIWIFSLGLRLWGLSRFNTLVFDEIYFARFANNYLNQTAFFDAHPPLGKYLIAVGIWLGGFNPFGYRWMNALVGSLLPLLTAGIAFQLSQRRGFSLLAGLLTATDGLLLVESRYALINIYLLFFGFAGQWLLLLGLQGRDMRRWLGLGLGAIALGATVGVKWSGLGFLLGIVITWSVAWGLTWLTGRAVATMPLADLPWMNWLRLRWWQLGLVIPLIMAIVYSLVWLPHLHQNPETGFWGLQRQLLEYHKGVSHQAHTYCSRWYSWPMLIRPMSYFYQRAMTATETMPMLGPPLPWQATRLIYDVHAMGNPLLWWLSTLAMIYLIVLLGQRLFRLIATKAEESNGFASPEESRWLLFREEALWVPLYLVSNYAANLLPWAIVSRCLFIYHYMPASVFSFLGLAWVLERALASVHRWERGLAVTAIFLILLALVFWLPIYLGLPLSPTGFYRRMWFPSWI